MITLSCFIRNKRKLLAVIYPLPAPQSLEKNSSVIPSGRRSWYQNNEGQLRKRVMMCIICVPTIYVILLYPAKRTAYTQQGTEITRKGFHIL